MTSNISVVVSQNLGAIEQLKNPDVMLRTMATTLTAVIRKRVHEDGLDSNGQQIGTYSKQYMVVRTGAYRNAEKFSRGKNKGKIKNAGHFTNRVIRLDKNTGVFTGTEKEGMARAVYNRSGDTKVIASLTRQMENDMAACETDPIKTESGYGIGYKNPFNFDKSQWVEQTYEKPIWKLTQSEEQLAADIAQKFTKNALPGTNS